MTDKEFSYQYALGTLDKETLIQIAITTTSKKILTALSSDKHWVVRYWVSENKSTPSEVKYYLYTDRQWGY